jgi:hypothetical protein
MMICKWRRAGMRMEREINTHKKQRSTGIKFQYPKKQGKNTQQKNGGGCCS